MSIFGLGFESVVMDADEVSEDLGIGSGLEGVTLLDELVFEEIEVLDDAVMDEDDAAALVEVGM
jgi:hypothetical protein